MNLRLVLAIVLSSLVVACGGGGSDSSHEDRANRLTSDKETRAESARIHPIQWQSKLLKVTAIPGRPRSATVELLSPSGTTTPININVLDVPDSLLSVSPRVIGPMVPGSKTTVTVTIEVPAKAHIGRVVGGILTARASGRSDLETQVLPIEVLVAPISDVTFYREAQNPALFSVNLPEGTSATPFGKKSPDGKILEVRGVTFAGADQSLRSILQDEFGRPVEAILANGGRLTFEWNGDTNFVMTVFPSDGSPRFTVPLSLPSPLHLQTSAGQKASTRRSPTIFATAAADSPNTVLTAYVHSSGPETDATVWAKVQHGQTIPINFLMGERQPGVYVTEFYNFPSDIPTEMIGSACKSVVGAYSNTCSVLRPIAVAMIGGGCLYTAALAPECELLFAVAGASCAMNAFVPRPPTGPFFPGGLGRGATDRLCDFIEGTLSYFAPDGIDIIVTATKGMRKGSGALHVDGGQAEASVQISLASPSAPQGRFFGSGTAGWPDIPGCSGGTATYEGTAKISYDSGGPKLLLSPRHRATVPCFDYSVDLPGPISEVSLNNGLTGRTIHVETFAGCGGTCTGTVTLDVVLNVSADRIGGTFAFKNSDTSGLVVVVNGSFD